MVANYQRNIQACIRKQADTNDQDVPFCDWVMVFKVRKHLKDHNQRSAAKYVARRLGEFPEPLSEWAREAMRATPLRAAPGEVIFTRPDGTLRSFAFARAVA